MTIGLRARRGRRAVGRTRPIAGSWRGTAVDNAADIEPLLTRPVCRTGVAKAPVATTAGRSHAQRWPSRPRELRPMSITTASQQADWPGVASAQRSDRDTHSPRKPVIRCRPFVVGPLSRGATDRVPRSRPLRATRRDCRPVVSPRTGPTTTPSLPATLALPRR